MTKEQFDRFHATCNECGHSVSWELIGTKLMITIDDTHLPSRILHAIPDGCFLSFRSRWVLECDCEWRDESDSEVLQRIGWEQNRFSINSIGETERDGCALRYSSQALIASVIGFAPDTDINWGGCHSVKGDIIDAYRRTYPVAFSE